jgi:hypothetical protein
MWLAGLVGIYLHVVIPQQTIATPVAPQHSQDTVQRIPITALDAIPALNRRVTLNFPQAPLRQALAELSHQTGIVFRCADETIAEQRVSLFFTDEPLHVVMTRLLTLLSHHVSKPACFQWEQETDTRTSASNFVLRRRQGYAATVRDALAKPAKDAVSQLKKWRDSESDVPELIALRGLSDEQLATLIQGKQFVVPVTDVLFKAVRSGYDNAVIAASKDDRLKKPGEFNFTAKEMTVGLCTATGDNGLSPNMPIYMLSVVPGRIPEGLPSFGGLWLNGDGLHNDLRELLLPETTEKGGDEPIIDLNPALSASEVTEEDRHSLSFILSTLSKTAKISLYCEAFLKGDRNGLKPAGLILTRGTLPQLLNGICRQWGYNICKDGDDYILWSRTWAFDKQADISDRQLTALKRKWCDRNGPLQDSELVALAQTFTYEQMYHTLPFALPDLDFEAVRNLRAYQSLKIIGFLSPTERESALAEGGVAVNMLSPELQAWLSEQVAIQQGRPPILGQFPFLPVDVLNRRLHLHPSAGSDGYKDTKSDIGINIRRVHF